MPFEGDRRVLQQMVHVLFRSEQHSFKVIKTTSWTSYTLIWSLITCLLLATVPTETSKSITTVASFVYKLKKKQKKNKKQKKGNFTVFVESHAFNSCLIVDMLHQLSAMYAVYLMVVRW